MIDILLVPLLLLIRAIINLAVWAVIVDVVLGWLFIADVVNRSNRFVISLSDVLSRITAVMLGPIQRNIPCLIGSVDMSPFILILMLSFFENVITRCIMRLS